MSSEEVKADWRRETRENAGVWCLGGSRSTLEQNVVQSRSLEHAKNASNAPVVHR